MITVIGSINVDLVAVADALPQAGETLLGKAFVTAPGGKGANQALAATRAGASVRMVGAVGSDPFASVAVAQLAADGVALSGVETVPGATGVAVILVGRQGDNVIVVVPGANAQVGVRQAERSLAEVSDGLVLLQQEIPAATVSFALDAARAKGMLSVLNTAPASDDSRLLAAKADVLVANEGEFERIAGHGAFGRAVADLARTNGQTVVVTRGAAGALVATADGEVAEIRAPTVEAIDTVGAGDTFCGYLAAGLSRGLPLRASIDRAVRAASLACTRTGAQSAVPTADEVD